MGGGGPIREEAQIEPEPQPRREILIQEDLPQWSGTTGTTAECSGSFWYLTQIHAGTERRSVTLNPTFWHHVMSINFDQEPQSKQKLYLESLEIAILDTQIWVESKLCSKRETERIYKHWKRGTSEGLHELFWKSCDWYWQASFYCAMHN